MKRYQFVSWFPELAFGFRRLDPDKTDIALIYEWVLFFGFWEIRRLATWMDAYSDEAGPMERQSGRGEDAGAGLSVEEG